MVRYFYAWTPLVIVAAVFVLSMPWLGLIALMIVAIMALVALVALVAALARAVVFVPYMLSRAISRRWHIRSDGSPRTAPALSPAGDQNDSVWQGAPSHQATLGVGRELQTPQHTFPEGHVS